MDPFIRSDQYHFIKQQTQILINGHSTVNDGNVLQALKSLAKEKVVQLFEELTEEQEELIQPIINVQDTTDAEKFLATIVPYVVPFKSVSQQAIKKLFPKAKKLKVPAIEDMDLREISYLSWIDEGSSKKYLVAMLDNKLVGLQGSFKRIQQKGICALCNKHEEVGLFLTEKKGEVRDTFIKKGNYICIDSLKCNENLISVDKLHEFIERVKK